MYEVGDKVVHPMHGAGVIGGITRERLDGRWCTYYVFRMDTDDLVLKIPEENCDLIGMRALATAEEMAQVLARIPDLGVDMEANWNQRCRENKEHVKSGNLYEVALVIKGLMYRDRERGLSNIERKMLRSARQILLSEMAMVQNVAYGEAEQRLDGLMMVEVE